VTVSLGFGDDHRAEVGVCARSILDHDWLLPLLAEMVSDNAEQHIRRSTCAEGDNNADCSGWKIDCMTAADIDCQRDHADEQDENWGSANEVHRHFILLQIRVTCIQELCHRSIRK
jgi:hypothetical protein